MPPDGGETFIVNLHAPTGKRTTMNESSSGALGIPELRSPAAMNFHSKILQENLHPVNQVRTIFPAVPQILVWLICKIHTRGLISGTFNKNHLHRGKI